MITQTFDLNLIPEQEPVIVHVNQYDVGTGRLIAKLYDQDIPYTANGTAVIQGTKPDGKGFAYPATLSGNTVTADLTEQMSVVAGDVRGQIVIVESSGQTGTFVFVMRVQKSALPADSDMSESDYQIIEELLREVEEAVLNAPYIGANGNWWVWSSQEKQYVDSGVDASITVQIADITMLDPDATPRVTNTGTATDPIFHLFIPRGKGISRIEKISTSGLNDTYTITYSDGSTYDYVVKNGRGVARIEKTSTSGLVDTYTITYNDTTTSTFNVTNGKTAYQSAVEGGYEGTEEQFEEDLNNFRVWATLASTKAAEASSSADAAARSATDASNSADDASDSATSADESADKAEAYAAGTIDGSPVPATHENYHNNAKWYSEQASDSAGAADESAQDSEGYAVGKRNGADVGVDDPTYHNNSKWYASRSSASATAAYSSEQNAASSASDASGYASNASNSADDAAAQAGLAQTYSGEAYNSAGSAEDYAELSKSYAVGTNGEARQGDATDNSKYYSEQAAGAVASANEVLDDVIDAGNDAITAIQNALDNDAPEFEINFLTGHLMYGGSRFIFDVNQTTGHLLWGLTI